MLNSGISCTVCWKGYVSACVPRVEQCSGQWSNLRILHQMLYPQDKNHNMSKYSLQHVICVSGVGVEQAREYDCSSIDGNQWDSWTFTAALGAVEYHLTQLPACPYTATNAAFPFILNPALVECESFLKFN